MKSDDVASHRFAADLTAIRDLRARMQQDPQGALKEAAQQFEGMFLQMVMKSMRDATPAEGPMESDASRFYTSLLDQQLSSQLGASGSLGFAKLIEAQLGRGLPGRDGAAISSAEAMLRVLSGTPSLPAGAIAGAARNMGTAAAAASNEASAADHAVSAAARDFAQQVWPHALDASRETGVPAAFLVAQAALESGWGKSEIRRADGSASFNVFGIKAGRSWQGDTVEAATTEFVDGVAQQSRERFRAYGSYAEAFRDYARLIAGNPRFAGVLGQQDGTAFARSLQQAGYATDPAYADKLSRIINGGTLRQALAG